MSTARQKAANQANAQKSTGPTTDAGKEKSSHNHLSSGFASNTRFIQDENREEFYDLLIDLQLEYQPATPTEQILVEEMAHNQWIVLRAHRLQAQYFFRSGPNILPPELSILIRYKTAAHRAFLGVHTVLVKAQKEREKSKIGFESKSLLATTPSVTPKTTPAVSEVTSEPAPIPEIAPLVHKMAVGTEEFPTAA